MKFLALPLLAATLGSCAMAPLGPSPAQLAESQAKFAQLTAGKVAGPPLSCLQTFRASDMVVIDDNTVAFKRGSGTVYVNHLEGGCSHLGQGNYALVTRQSGSGLCHGDIAEVADVSNGMTVGSCVIGDFVPYTRVG